MAYSPVCKSKNKKLNNESLLEGIRNSIDKEYCKALSKSIYNKGYRKNTTRLHIQND